MTHQLIELLFAMKQFYSMWLKFFKGQAELITDDDSVGRNTQRMDSIYLQDFIRETLGASIRDKLRDDIVHECEKINMYTLFPLANVTE